MVCPDTPGPHPGVGCVTGETQALPRVHRLRLGTKQAISKVVSMRRRLLLALSFAALSATLVVPSQAAEVPIVAKPTPHNVD